MQVIAECPLLSKYARLAARVDCILRRGTKITRTTPALPALCQDQIAIRHHLLDVCQMPERISQHADIDEIRAVDSAISIDLEMRIDAGALELDKIIWIR